MKTQGQQGSVQPGEFDPGQLQDLIRLAKNALWAGKEVHRKLQAAGVTLSPANFYSSIPTVEDVERSFEYAPEQLEAGGPYVAGGVFEHDRIVGFMQRIERYAGEFDPPLEGDLQAPAGYFWKNPAFSFLDAMAYYCVLRAVQPDVVVEIGSGFSTLVADQALRANGKGRITVIEPYPKAFLREIPTVSDLLETAVQDIPEAELVALVDGCQVCFIDSTHTVKSGSDCLYLYLKVLPRVTSHVVCHSHDIYLPYAPPSRLALDLNVFWTEQYLLQAYLLHNPCADVLFGSAYVTNRMPEAAAAMMRGRYPAGGASLWYDLNARGSAPLPQGTGGHGGGTR